MARPMESVAKRPRISINVQPKTRRRLRPAAAKRGDVVPVGFVFSGESGQKLRPALVISSFELAVNPKTAKQLGLAIPQARLARADRGIQ